MKKILTFFILSFIILVTNSCIKDQLGFDKIRTSPWEAKWAFPLVNTSMSLDEILNDTLGFIHEGEDGLLSLVYVNDSMVSIDAKDLISIPDQDIESTEDFILPDLPPGEPITIPVTFNFPFETEKEDQRIDSIFFSEGNYIFEIITDLNKNEASVDVLVPSLVSISNHEALSFTIDLSNGDGGEVNWETDLDLSSYILIFDEALPNELKIECEFNIVSDDNPNNSPYFFNVNSQFSNLQFEYLFGYFARYDVELHDTISLDIYKLNQEGSFQFGPGSVNFDFTTYNSYGLPINLELTEARAFHGDDETFVDIYLFGDNTPNIFEINYPDYSQIGEIVTTTTSGENSNIHEALNISPNKIFIEVLGTLNPEENPSIPNFVLGNSQFNTDIALELELFGSASGFRIADTLDFSVDLGDLNSLDLIFDIENGFPIEASIWLHLIDSLGSKIYEVSSYDELLIAGGETGGEENNYRVLNPEKKLTTISIDNEGVYAIKQTRQIVVNAELSTTDGELAKIYSDYSLNLKLGANLGYKY